MGKTTAECWILWTVVAILLCRCDGGSAETQKAATEPIVVDITTANHEAFFATHIRSLVLFYSPYNRRALALLPVFSDVHRSLATFGLDKKIQLGRVNCVEDQIVCETHADIHVPTVKYVNKKLGGFLFNSFYNTRHLTDWVVQVLTVVEEIHDLPELKDLVQSTPSFGLIVAEGQNQGMIEAVKTLIESVYELDGFRFAFLRYPTIVQKNFLPQLVQGNEQSEIGYLESVLGSNLAEEMKRSSSFLLLQIVNQDHSYQAILNSKEKQFNFANIREFLTEHITPQGPVFIPRHKMLKYVKEGPKSALVYFTDMKTDNDTNFFSQTKFPILASLEAQYHHLFQVGYTDRAYAAGLQHRLGMTTHEPELLLYFDSSSHKVYSYRHGFLLPDLARNWIHQVLTEAIPPLNVSRASPESWKGNSGLLEEYTYESLRKAFAGQHRPLLIFFTAPACGFCKRALPHLKQLALEYQTSPVKIGFYDCQRNTMPPVIEIGGIRIEVEVPKYPHIVLFTTEAKAHVFDSKISLNALRGFTVAHLG